MSLWGSRFGEPPDEAVWRFTVSTTDRRLLEVDVEGSLAHVAGLGAAGVLPGEEAARLEEGLRRILVEARRGSFSWSEEDEDVHSAVERRLGELVGEVAGKLHTGRSRNDQVALDLRLWMRDAARRHLEALIEMVAVLGGKASEVGETVVASYTHLQQAQPVALAHHLLAHAWPLVRDAWRFRDALARIEVSPLGASAGGGTGLPLDPAVPASRLGLPAVFENSLDAVSSRDAAAEFAFCCTRTLVDLSRLSEDLILWASSEFGWVTLAHRHTTGSSALPQKRNPDAAELTRGKAASAIGRMAALLALEKGLALSYNRDLQEDKEHVFAISDDLEGALGAMARLFEGAVFDPPPPIGAVVALDLAEVLVRRGVAFREAHQAVGQLIKRLEDAGRTLESMTGAELGGAHPAFEPGDREMIDPKRSVAARRSPGSGSFTSVEAQLARIERELESLRR
jgi:argininosuccinate lyase